MRKVVRALCYLKELCLMAFFKLFGVVCRCCSAKYRELWLVCERGNDARPATKHNRQCHRCQNTQPIVKASFVFLQRSFFTVATAASGCSGCGSDLPRATERQTPLPEQKARVDLLNIAGTAAGVISVTLVRRAVYWSSLTLSAPLPPREKVPRSTAFSDFCAGWRFAFNGDFSPPR